LVCPGIANSSESIYIRTYVQYAQDCGFRVAVLNHLGALKNIKLTAPRIFTYGSHFNCFTLHVHSVQAEIRPDYRHLSWSFK
jgi:predicted alpha/beta-fold hydrolase